MSGKVYGGGVVDYCFRVLRWRLVFFTNLLFGDVSR